MSCTKVVKTVSIKGDKEFISLNIHDMELRHGQHIRVCFAQTPPVIDPSPVKVILVLNNQKFFVRQSRMEGAFGASSSLYSDQLQNCCGKIKARQYIDLIYAADTKDFNYCGPCRCLPRANINFPRVPDPSSAKEAPAKEA